MNKGRLGELAKSSSDGGVKGCARYLLEDFEEAKRQFVSEFQSEPGAMEPAKRWFIFASPEGKKFIEAIAKPIL